MVIIKIPRLNIAIGGGSLNVLISGCSFTHWPEEPGSDKNICWPTYLNEKRPHFNIKNLAEPGAGNLYIANGIVNALLAEPKKYDLVLVMWSGMTRLDFLTDLSNQDWASLFNAYGFYRRIEQCPNRLGYIFSGGEVGPWTVNPATRTMFRELYKVSDHASLGYLNLIEIIKTQYFLKSMNIPYRFMSYVNYWGHQTRVSPNGDFGVMSYPELHTLVNSIDFSQWIFADHDRTCIYEMAKANDDYHGDRFHPGAKTHRQWVDIMLDHI